MKISVFIVDDEPIILQSLTTSIAKTFHDMRIVATATNGQAAYERIKELRPDIAIIDIHLPLMNGIALIEKLKSEGIESHYVILSAHREFEYAKSAISLGVIDYLLKPTTIDTLATCFNGIKNRMQEAQDKDDRLISYQQELPDMIRLHLIELLQGQPSSKQLDQHLSHYGLTFREPTLMYLMPLHALPAPMHSKILNNAREIFEGQKSGFCLILNHELILLVGDSFANRSSVLSLKTEYMEYYKYAPTLYESNRFTGITDLHIIYRELLSCQYMNFYEGIEGSIINVRRFHGVTHSYETSSPDYFVELIAALKHLQYDELIERFENIMNRLSETQAYAPEIIYECSYKLLKDCLTLELPIQLKHTLDRLTINDLLEHPNMKHLQNYMITHLNTIISTLQEHQPKKDKIIDMVISYCYKYYNRDIALDEIASHVSMSKSYFCTYFKQHTDKSFYTYLTSLRIDMAKDLLQNTNQKINAIAQQVGFSSPSHFGKTFKELTGVTPLVYRQQC